MLARIVFRAARIVEAGIGCGLREFARLGSAWRLELVRRPPDANATGWIGRNWLALPSC
jgi:hypothetical protein